MSAPPPAPPAHPDRASARPVELEASDARSSRGCVLVIDDEPEMCDMLEVALGGRGFEISSARSAEEALSTIEDLELHAVLTDMNLGAGRMNGIALCERIRERRPDLPTIVMTAFGSLETAVASLRAGAFDFVTKPVNNDLLALTLERAVQHHALNSEVKRLRRRVDQSQRFDRIIGQSPAMAELYRLIDRVAESFASVLITGDSGTGKELVARAIHARSTRSEGHFVAVNCAAMPDHLLESELFGHAKGAFTDAGAARPGLFVEASGGTLFLDEIAELPLPLQPKLLRALQERKVRPVGSNREVDVDVRFVAATNRDLETEVEERRFREDLYFRINVVHVALPPLRSRGGDVLLLAQHFVERFASLSEKEVTGVSAEAAEKLQLYPWPGNVRELQNCIERAVALTEHDQITACDLPERIRKHRPSHVVVASSDPSELVPLAEVEKRYILEVLDSVGGNKTMAGRILGVDRKTLHRKLERWTTDSKG